jgi:uncharacterized protein (TIGR03083 family)
MLSLDEARRAIRREMQVALDELTGLDGDGWDRATRCQGWTVADLVAHLVWGQRLEAQGVAAIAEGRTEALDVPDTSVADPRALPAQLGAAHEELWAALQDRTADDLSSSAAMPYGPVPLGLFLQVVAMEVGVHHSDLRAALGLPDDLGADVARASAAFLAAFLPVLAAGGDRPAEPVRYVLRGRSFELEWSSGAGAEETVTIAGPDSELGLFLMGRRDLEELQVDGDAVLAARFKQFVPGP